MPFFKASQVATYTEGYYIGYKTPSFESPSNKFSFRKAVLDSEHKLEYNLTDLARNSSYIISVSAFNAKGAGPPSNEVICSTAERDPPQPPVIRLISTTANSVTAEWHSVDDELPLGYKLYVKDFSRDNEQWFEYADIRDRNTHSYLIADLKCGTSYQMYLVGYNEAGVSSPSEMLSFKTEGSGEQRGT